MAKKHRQHKTSRKKRHHTHDSSLPHIEVCPTFHRRDMAHLPDVILEEDTSLPPSTKAQVTRRLNFVDHRDLRHLSCIRVVSTIQSRYKGSLMTTTSGCYCPAFQGKNAEIRLAADLVSPRGLRQRIHHWLFWHDPVVNTLFHEIGHHKAAHTRGVSRYKDEAYAEKYMQEYRAAWFTRYGAPRLLYQVARRLAAILRTLRDIIRRIVHRQDDTENMIQRAMILRLFWKPKESEQHPLQRPGYRKKFDVDNR